MLPSTVHSMPWTSHFQINHETRSVSIPFSQEKSESEILAEQMNLARSQKTFDIISRWRNELFPILNLTGRSVAIERSAAALFGIIMRGVHCTAYTYHLPPNQNLPTPSSSSPPSQFPYLIVPRRAATKESYPSMLDNTIAGGLAAGETPWAAYIREAGEEAGLVPAIAARAKATGTISYIHARDLRAGGEVGLVQPEVQFCWDLELFPCGRQQVQGCDNHRTSEMQTEADKAEIPHPNDNEVDNFTYMTFAECWAALINDEFKPNCGLVLIDFFVRWGYIRAGAEETFSEAAEHAQEEEEGIPLDVREGFEIPAQEYAELVSRLHRRLAFEGMRG